MPSLGIVMGLLAIGGVLAMRGEQHQLGAEEAQDSSRVALAWDWEAAGTVSPTPGPVAYIVGTADNGVFVIRGGDEWRFARLDVTKRAWEILSPPDPAIAGVLFGAATAGGFIVVSSGQEPVAAEAVVLSAESANAQPVATPSIIPDQWTTAFDGEGEFAILTSRTQVAVLDVTGGDWRALGSWTTVDGIDLATESPPLVEVVGDRAFVVAGAIVFVVHLPTKTLELTIALPAGFDPSSITHDGNEATVWGRREGEFAGYLVSSQSFVTARFPDVEPGNDAISFRVHQIAGAPRVAVVTSDVGTSVYEESAPGRWRQVATIDLPDARSVIAGSSLVIGEHWIADAQ